MNFNDNDGDLYVKTKDEKKLLTILCNEIWKKKFIEYLFLSFIHKKKISHDTHLLSGIYYFV